MKKPVCRDFEALNTEPSTTTYLSPGVTEFGVWNPRISNCSVSPYNSSQLRINRYQASAPQILSNVKDGVNLIVPSPVAKKEANNCLPQLTAYAKYNFCCSLQRDNNLIDHIKKTILRSFLVRGINFYPGECRHQNKFQIICSRSRYWINWNGYRQVRATQKKF